MMKAILIDPWNRTLQYYEFDGEDPSEVLGGPEEEIYSLKNRDLFLADGKAWEKWEKGKYAGIKVRRGPDEFLIIGKILVVGIDGPIGDLTTVDVKSTLAQIKYEFKWMNPEHVEFWALEMGQLDKEDLK